jgi:hypothetical protein
MSNVLPQNPLEFTKGHIEKVLRGTDWTDRYSLEATEGGSSAWREFCHMKFDEILINTHAICRKCKQVYGCRTGNVVHTSGMAKHKCPFALAAGQQTLEQATRHQVGLCTEDKKSIKTAQVVACVQGHLSFLSMENPRLINLIQSFVDIAVKNKVKLDV